MAFIVWQSLDNSYSDGYYDYADDNGAPQWLRHVTADARGICGSGEFQAVSGSARGGADHQDWVARTRSAVAL